MCGATVQDDAVATVLSVMMTFAVVLLSGVIAWLAMALLLLLVSLGPIPTTATPSVARVAPTPRRTRAP